MKACGSVLVEAKNVINFERAIELAEELGLGFQEAEELLIATEAGIQKLPVTVVEVEAAVTSLMESESKQIINKLESHVLSETEAFLKRQYIVDQIELVMADDIIEIKKLSETEKTIVVNFEGQLQNMLLDVEHVFIPKIKFRWNYDPILNIRQCEEFGLVGWHYKY